MLTPLEAYRRVLRNDPTFKLEGGVDYDHEYYVFTGPLDMYAVDKRLGTVVAFVPTTDMKKYFDAVKRRPLDVSSLQHNDNDELYLEHFGIKNMKWGVRRFQNKDGSLTEAGRKRYGSGNDEEFSGGGGGGGAPEEDEEMKKKIEEAAKKAGMTVAEYRKKMGSKLYDLFGGKYKKEAEEYSKAADDTLRYAQSVDRKGDADLAKAASARRKGNTGAHSSYKTYGDNAKLAAKKEYERASTLRSGASKTQEKYEKSLAGRYDKFKADRERKDRMKRDKMIEDAFRKETPGRTHVLPKMKSATATAKPMRKLTSKELAKIRSEARIKQLKKDGDYTGEYKKKRRK